MHLPPFFTHKSHKPSSLRALVFHIQQPVSLWSVLLVVSFIVFAVCQLAYSSAKGFLRRSFFVDWFFLAWRRLSLEALVARVGILFFRFLFNASSFFRSRESAISLLRCWLRSSWQVTTILVSLCVIRTALSVLLTCWPPFADARNVWTSHCFDRSTLESGMEIIQSPSPWTAYKHRLINKAARMGFIPRVYSPYRRVRKLELPCGGGVSFASIWHSV